MKLTASKIDLARRCLWPFRPDAGPRNAGTSYAAAGHAEHAHIEHTLRTGDETPQSPTHARWLREWYETAPRTGWIVERPIALDPRSGETRIGPEGWDHRDYSWAPGWRWMLGTPDAYRIAGDGWVEVYDWKTGEAGHVKDPATNGQLLLLATALVREWRASGARLHLVLVNDRRLWAEPPAKLPRLDLEIFRDELVALLDGADDDPQATPGHWCRSLFCDYLGRCPSTAGALTRAVPYPGEHVVALHSGDFTGPEHVGWQWALCQAASKRLDEARTAAIMWLKAEPGRAAALPGGGVVEMETTRRESVDATLAIPLLRELFGARADEAIETKLSVTKGRIEDLAVEGRREDETKAAAKRRVLDALRAAGAVRETEYQSPKEREARRDEFLAVVQPDLSSVVRCSWCNTEHAGGPECCPEGI